MSNTTTMTKRMISGYSLSMGGTVYWAGGGWTGRIERATVNDDATDGGAGRTARNLELAERAARYQHVTNVRVIVAETVAS